VPCSARLDDKKVKSKGLKCYLKKKECVNLVTEEYIGVLELKIRYQI